MVRAERLIRSLLHLPYCKHKKLPTPTEHNPRVRSKSLNNNDAALFENEELAIVQGQKPFQTYLEQIQKALSSYGKPLPRLNRDILNKLIDALPNKVGLKDQYAFKMAAQIPSGEFCSVSGFEKYFVNLFINAVEKLGFRDSLLEEYHNSLNPLAGMCCLADKVRTKYFVQAVMESVDEKLQSGEQDINVLDAGCGPIPILGISAAIIDPRVKVTCLESNPQSHKIAESIVDYLVESGAIKKDQIQVKLCDAKRYKPDKKDYRYDVLVSETMDSGLLCEPIVEIFHHVKGFAKDDASFIPSSIELKLKLRDSCNEPLFLPNIIGNMEYYDLIDVGSTSFQYNPATTDEIPICTFEAKNLAQLPKGLYFPVIVTSIKVGDKSLNAENSLICRHCSVGDIRDPNRNIVVNDHQKPGALSLSYIPGSSVNKLAFSQT